MNKTELLNLAFLLITFAILFGVALVQPKKK